LYHLLIQAARTRQQLQPRRSFGGVVNAAREKLPTAVDTVFKIGALHLHVLVANQLALAERTIWHIPVLSKLPGKLPREKIPEFQEASSCEMANPP